MGGGPLNRLLNGPGNCLMCQTVYRQTHSILTSECGPSVFG